MVFLVPATCCNEPRRSSYYLQKQIRLQQLRPDRSWLHSVQGQLTIYPLLPFILPRQGMARVHTDWEDKLCLRCDDPKPEEVVAESWYLYRCRSRLFQPTSCAARCSWCTDKTMHRLRQRNTFKRDIYDCRFLTHAV